LAWSGSDDEGFPRDYDDVDGDGLELVDAQELGDLAQESFDQAELPPVMRVMASAASPSAGCVGLTVSPSSVQ
jgi:hypothetical protein